MIKNFKNLVTSVDVLNTLHGGVSEPFLSHREQLSGREMRIRVPGINKEALQAEINDNMLSVFYLIPIHSNGKLIYIPQVIYNKRIPYFIEIAGINASYEENDLVVKLPFNELSNGYNRKIRVGDDE